MKVIFGLGNPGKEYDATRHNAGWWLLDHLARTWPFESWRKDRDAHVADGYLGPLRVRLVKPQTYMNRSGEVLRPYLGRAGFEPREDLLVVVDDIAIPVGEMRFRATGSTGGHNGLKSMQAHLGHQNYARLRIGIRPVDERRVIGNMADFVLRVMPRDERDLVEALFPRLTTVVDAWVREGSVKTASVHGR
jgi:PTH1 family peptidyl-tRNA hydrolase